MARIIQKGVRSSLETHACRSPSPFSGHFPLSQCRPPASSFFRYVLKYMEFLRIRSSALTWSLPPHPPPGRFAPRIFSPHYCFSRAVCPDGLTSKPHHAHRKFPRLMWIVLPATGIDFQPQTAEPQIRLIIPRQGRVYKDRTCVLENRKESRTLFSDKSGA